MVDTAISGNSIAVVVCLTAADAVVVAEKTFFHWEKWAINDKLPRIKSLN